MKKQQARGLQLLPLLASAALQGAVWYSPGFSFVGGLYQAARALLLLLAALL